MRDEGFPQLYRFNDRANDDQWPEIGVCGWPVNEIMVTFRLGDQDQKGRLHHNTLKSAWIIFNGQLIKRHQQKHQVKLA